MAIANGYILEQPLGLKAQKKWLSMSCVCRTQNKTYFR